jgi:rod shape-determining protein MreD
MHPYLAVPFIIFVSLLQSTLSPRIQIGSVWPDFLLLAVMSWALLRRTDEALVWAFAGGLLVDLLSGGPFGASAIGLMVVVLIASATVAGVFRDRTIMPIIAAFVGTLAFHGVYVAAMLLFGQRVDGLNALFRIALPAAIYNAVLSWFMFRMMAGIDRRIRPRALDW